MLNLEGIQIRIDLRGLEGTTILSWGSRKILDEKARLITSLYIYLEIIFFQLIG